MKVILKQDMENLGKRGDTVEVAQGYGRNYLIPKKIALEVTSSNMKMIEIERQALIKDLEKERLTFQGLIQKMDQTTLTFKRKAGEKDVIFGSVSSSDIKDALADAGLEIDKKKILLEEPIKRLGNYTVAIKVFHEDRAEIKIEVVKEGEEKAKEEREKEEIPEGKKEDIEAKQEEPEMEEQKKEEGILEEEKDKEGTASEEKSEESEEEKAEPDKEEKEEEGAKKERT